MKNISMRLKITVWFSAIMIFIVAATFGVILWVDYSVIQKTIQDNLIETVEDNVDEIEFFKDVDSDETDHNADQYIIYENGHLEIDDDFLDKVNGISTALYTESGRLLYGENLIAKETSGLYFSDRKVQKIEAEGMKYYVFDCALTYEGTEGLWLRGIVSEDQGTQQLASIVRISSIALPALLILAVIGGYWIATRALKPVRKIAESAAQISHGKDLSKRIDIGSGSDELHELADVFNDMFSRLDEAFKAEQQFTSDASHELRTPMAVIMAQCEYTLEEPRTPEEYEEALTVIRRQGGKMSRLIDDMLCFARLERNHSSYPKETLDFSSLAESVCEDMALLRDKNITLTTKIESDISIIGNQMLLSRLLVNLISNAYRYGRENGHIEVCLKRDNGIFLSVTDDGIGIPFDRQKQIFERFYRCESARSSEGTGLGLAMVKEIAEYHGGNVSVVSEEGKGSDFSVNF